MADRNFSTAQTINEIPDNALFYLLTQGPLRDAKATADAVRRYMQHGTTDADDEVARAAAKANADAIVALADRLTVTAQWQSIIVVSTDSLRVALAAQANTDSFLGLYFAVEVELDGETYPQHLVATVDPHSSTVERWFTIPLGAHARIDNTGKVTDGVFTQAILDYLTLGDTPLVHSVADAATLNAHLGNQPRNEEPLWIRVTRGFRVAPNDYAAGETWYVPPRSNVPIKLLDSRPDLGRIDIVPSNVADAAGVQTDYQVTLSLAQEAVDDLTARGANQLDIWFNNTGVHAVEPYVPALAAVLNINVNANEWRAIAVGNAKIIPVRAVWRRGGQYVAQISTYVTIGGASTTASKAEIDAAVDAYLRANPPPAGEDSVARRGVAVNDGRLDAIEANGWVRETRLSPTLQAALLDLRIAPVRDAITGEYVIVFANGGILRSDFWYRVEANGQPVVPRKEWDSPANITFTPTADQVQRMAAVDPNEVTVVVTFYPSESGGELTNHARVVAVRAPAKPTPDRDVGGAFNIGDRSIWHAYDLTEDREDAAWYMFQLRDGGSDRYTPTQLFRGDMIPANAGGAFTQGEDDQMGLIIARAEADGARVLSVARDANNPRRLYLSTNSSWNVHKLIRLGR